MLTAAAKALGDVASSDFRSILWTAIGLALLLFVTLFLAVQGIFWFFTLVTWPWAEALLAIGTGLGMLVLFFFLMAPVTSAFAGLYLDRVAALVERRHYPDHKPGTPLSGWTAVMTALQFASLVLLLNILALPLIFTGIGIVVIFVINAYLLSREFFEMAAMRHMPKAEAKDLRANYAVSVFTAGLIPAALALIPGVNLIVPLFATSYFVHVFKQLKRP
jgi:CysZ protein